MAEIISKLELAGTHAAVFVTIDEQVGDPVCFQIRYGAYELMRRQQA